MSYLHCHKCHWGQDDFWDFSFGKHGYFWRWRYNPISCFLSHLFGRYGYLKPRRIKHDKSVIEDYGWKRSDPHSWWLIWFEFKRMIRKFFHQKYWTYESWKRVVRKNGDVWPTCPECGRKELDID